MTFRMNTIEENYESHKIEIDSLIRSMNRSIVDEID